MQPNSSLLVERVNEQRERFTDSKMLLESAMWLVRCGDSVDSSPLQVLLVLMGV